MGKIPTRVEGDFEEGQLPGMLSGQSRGFIPSRWPQGNGTACGCWEGRPAAQAALIHLTNETLDSYLLKTQLLQHVFIETAVPGKKLCRERELLHRIAVTTQPI